MAREDPHFRLRLPAELKDALEASAKEANRSINAEIVWRLGRDLYSGDKAELVDRVTWGMKRTFAEIKLLLSQYERLLEAKNEEKEGRLIGNPPYNPPAYSYRRPRKKD